MIVVAEYFPGINPDFSSLAEKPDEPDDAKEKKDKKDSKKEKKPSIFELDKARRPEKIKDDKKEKNKEPPLEKLAEDEEQFVADSVVKARKQEVKVELDGATPDTSAEQEALMGATFLEALEEEVENGTPVDEALDNAEQQTFDIAGFEAPVEEEAGTEPDPGSDNEEALSNDAESDSDTAEADEDDDSATIVTPPPPLTPTPPVATPHAGGPGGGAGAYGGGAAGGGGAHGGAGGGVGGGVPPFGAGGPGGGFGASRTPGVVIPSPDVMTGREHVGRYVLIGGIVGYLIGRRRGRIKTEKKLLPIQDKLEKQVTDLQQKIANREEKIRQVMREQIVTRPAVSERLVGRMQELQELKAAKKSSTEAVPEQSGQPRKHPEQIGKFAMFGERPLRAEEHRNPERTKPVELMTVPELLVIAEKLKIEDSTVGRLFETNRLSDEGLRGAVRAYLNGERYDRILKENLTSPEKHLDYETDPLNRPQNNLPQVDSGNVNQPASQLEQLISNASRNIHTSSSLEAFDDPRPKSTKSNTPLVMAGGGVALLFILMLFLMAR